MSKDHNQLTPEVQDLIYLTASAVNNSEPNIRRISEMDLGKLYDFASSHQMVALVSIALKKTNVNNYKFDQYLEKVILVNQLMDSERKKILEIFENEHIWYLPLKGIVIKEYYPQPEMRQMADNDIMYDPTRAKDVRRIMEKMGYTTYHYGTGHQDDYWKPPIFHFEMHRMLFGEETNHRLFQYSEEIKNKLSEGKTEKDLSSEDFYVYMIAHIYKHYYWMGTGLRSLLDVYVFLKKFNEILNWQYIEEKIHRIGVEHFEKNIRELAQKIFINGDINSLTEDEITTLSSFTICGVYGTEEQGVRNMIQKYGKIKYFLLKVFPTMKDIKRYYPFFYNHRILIPFLVFYRLWKKRDLAIYEIKELFGINGAYIKHTQKK